MSLSQKNIKDKIKTSSNIKKTTKTMEMISAVKMRRMVSRTLNVREYARYAVELIESFSKNKSISHPLIQKRVSGKTLIILVASNKGLCGGYNARVTKALKNYIGDLDPKIFEVVAVGKHAEKMATRNKLNLLASFVSINEIVSPFQVNNILETVVEEFKKNKDYKKVVLIHTSFIKPLEYAPVVRRFLPISKGAIHDLSDDKKNTLPQKQINTSHYVLEPDASTLLNQIVPQLLLSIMFEAILESLASEHGSRMVAMKNATDNAKKIQDELVLWFNKARQASITREIAEISGGAEALTGASITI